MRSFFLIRFFLIEWHVHGSEFAVGIIRDRGRISGNTIIAGSPMTKIGHAAAFGAERKLIVIALDRLAALRTFECHGLFFHAYAIGISIMA